MEKPKGRGWYRIPIEKREQVVREYKEGKTILEISELVKITWIAAKRILMTAGVELKEQKRRNGVSDDNRKLILSGYASGRHSTQLSVETGFSQTAISKIVREAGLTRIPHEAHRRHAMDESVFDSITDESAYWIGFIMADGSVVESDGQSPSVHLGLSSVDHGHVEKFKSFLKSGHKISVVVSGLNGTTSSHFSVRSTRLAEALSKYGVVSRKSHTAKVLGLEFNRNFWRGVVDGDGCIHVRKLDGLHSLTLAGSECLLGQFLMFVGSFLKTDATVRPNASIFQVALVGSPGVEVIRELYSNSTIHLDRKYVLAKELL